MGLLDMVHGQQQVQQRASRLGGILEKLFVGVLALGVSVTAARAQAATTFCKDGTTSAAVGRGACSGHGGVDSKATAKARKADKAERKAAEKADKAAAKAERKAAKSARPSTSGGDVVGTTVMCSDGTTSTAGRGACSHHGGVATASAPATPTLPAAVPESSPARTRSNANSHAPSATAGSGVSENNDPTGAIAQCKDGLYSHAMHRRGACSRHGGVGRWL